MKCRIRMILPLLLALLCLSACDSSDGYAEFDGKGSEESGLRQQQTELPSDQLEAVIENYDSYEAWLIQEQEKETQLLKELTAREDMLQYLESQQRVEEADRYEALIEKTKNDLAEVRLTIEKIKEKQEILQEVIDEANQTDMAGDPAATGQ